MTVALFSPYEVLKKLRGIPYFFKNFVLYKSASTKDSKFPIRLKYLMPAMGDRFDSAGILGKHYFQQDIYVARSLYRSMPDEHVDVASRIDGFIAHLIIFLKVTYVDIRNLTSNIQNLSFKQGTITDLPYEDNSIQSLSSLHVLEHIGLGRYGDPVDPLGYIKGAKELQRVVAKDGYLYLSVPVGLERVCYDAHRVFNPNTILSLFDKMQLEKFCLIDDDENFKEGKDELFKQASSCDYGCGIFIFKKL